MKSDEPPGFGIFGGACNGVHHIHPGNWIELKGQLSEMRLHLDEETNLHAQRDMVSSSSLTAGVNLSQKHGETNLEFGSVSHF